MKPIHAIILILLTLSLHSCSSTKKLKVANARVQRLDSAYKQLQMQAQRQADSILKYKV